jgi:hypothetical protein
MSIPTCDEIGLNLPSRFRSLFAHDLFGKPLHAFPDQAKVSPQLASLLTVRCQRDSRYNAWSRISELVEA